MKKVITQEPNLVYVGHVAPYKVYAFNIRKFLENDTTILIHAHGDKDEFKADSLTCGVRLEQLSRIAPLADLIEYYIKYGYTVYEFENESEFGNWLANLTPTNNQSVVVSSPPSTLVLKIVDNLVAIRGASVIHAVRRIKKSNNGGFWITTLCGLEVYLNDSGIVKVNNNFEVLDAQMYIEDGIFQTCISCELTQKFRNWNHKTLKDNIEKVY